MMKLYVNQKSSRCTVLFANDFEGKIVLPKEGNDDKQTVTKIYKLSLTEVLRERKPSKSRIVSEHNLVVVFRVYVRWDEERTVLDEFTHQIHVIYYRV